MRVLLTGGCGYCGSVLVPKLLNAGHEVKVWDVQWFGNHLKPHGRLTVENVDIRSLPPHELWADAIIHLAAIANDPTGDLDPKLTWEVNALATTQLAAWAYQSCVKQFIYASSGSVYGVSDKPQVMELDELNPISEYNKTKMVSERVLLSYQDLMSVCIVRPATVCGMSPRMRLDLMVNQFCIRAFTSSRIDVWGGKHQRPNIHIEDLTDLYCWLLERPQVRGIFNASSENLSVLQIAQKVTAYLSCAIVQTPAVDPRSYRMNSDLLARAGFRCKRTVDDAIGDMLAAYSDGSLQESDACYNLKVMRANDIH